MTRTITKTIRDVRIKSADEGTIEAVFATLDVVDADGDVTRKGAFTEGASVIISAYNHGSWTGALPVGKGTIHERGNEAVLDGQFFLNTTHGHDTFETVKELGAAGLQEWSYSLEEVVSEKGTLDGRRVNFLTKIGTVREVSPTIRGAGVNTRVLATKSDRKTLVSTLRSRLITAARDRWGTDDNWVYVTDFDPAENVAYVILDDYDNPRVTYQVGYTEDGDTVTLDEDPIEVEQLLVYSPKGNTFAGQTDLALRAIKSLVTTGVERVECRTPQGKPIAEQKAALDTLSEALEPLRDALTTHQSTDEQTKTFLELVALKHGVAS